MNASMRRLLGELTSPEIAAALKATSILMLPLGAVEQHGPHLPLNTDVVVAEGISRRILARWGEKFDLWQLPSFALGLSREHDWAPGTLTLSVQTFCLLLREMAHEIVSALPAHNLVIVNGHGGNRGILENLLHEFWSDFGLNCCVLHPFDLAAVEAPGGGAAGGAQSADVHGGRSETSVMLALAPELVRAEMMPAPRNPLDARPDEAIQALIFDRGATFPWRTDDARLAHGGIIGDAAGATAERGEEIMARIVARAEGVLVRLLENRKAEQA